MGHQGGYLVAAASKTIQYSLPSALIYLRAIDLPLPKKTVSRSIVLELWVPQKADLKNETPQI